MKKILLTLFPLLLFAENGIFLTDKFKLSKGLIVILFIIFLYIVMLIIRYFSYKYIRKDDNEEAVEHYIFIKKALNISFVLISLIIIGFAYSENFAQGLAIFGVIGAGLTIVLKEVVLSMVAWVMLMTRNSIRLGDRIKIDRPASPIIGDVIDISLTKITLYENITNDGVASHKRAGRIIFVPNYYIFTNEIYNYTHLTMKTIIDLVELNLTYDSNFEKAEKVTTEIVEAYSGRYADMAKRQYDKLKDRYTLRNMPSYPRVVFYPNLGGDGITMAIWYIAPYREILKLKSEITKECVKRLNKEEDIKILYSGTSLFVEARH
jgi:small-conductance mechanosensitive channel